MTNDQKVNLLKKILTDFWECRDGCTLDEATTIIDTVMTILAFGGEEK